MISGVCVGIAVHLLGIMFLSVRPAEEFQGKT